MRKKGLFWCDGIQYQGDVKNSALLQKKIVGEGVTAISVDKLLVVDDLVEKVLLAAKIDNFAL
jgi:hypothetical protein